MSSFKEMQSIDRELFSELAESPISPARLAFNNRMARMMTRMARWLAYRINPRLATFYLLQANRGHPEGREDEDSLGSKGETIYSGGKGDKGKEMKTIFFFGKIFHLDDTEKLDVSCIGS